MLQAHWEAFSQLEIGLLWPITDLLAYDHAHQMQSKQLIKPLQKRYTSSVASFSDALTRLVRRIDNIVGRAFE